MNYLIVDGLNRMGRREEARLIVKRFTALCPFTAKSNYGNFDSPTDKRL